ncbi:MAG: ABC transporter permease [Micrococcales bacterium]|nr:ABC transporter permease [Micrococcales bacterium]
MTSLPMAQRLRQTKPATWALGIFASMLAVVLVAGAVTTEGYLTASNFKAILTSTAFVGIVAVGATVIMISGSQFSLSLGITVAVTSILFLFALRSGIIVAMIVTLVVGIVVFALQGFIIGGVGANPIIVTIGAAALQEGITTSRIAGNITPPAGVSIDFLATTVGGVPVSIFVFFAVALIVELFMRRTRWGRQIYLMGENMEAARAAGLPTASLTTLGFIIAGACVSIAGILVAGFNQNSNLATQGTFTFDAIAAVLVGGNAVTGGYGSVGRTVIGAIIIAAVSDMLLLRGASTGVQVLVKGVIVVLVVVFVQMTRRGRRA